MLDYITQSILVFDRMFILSIFLVVCGCATKNETKFEDTIYVDAASQDQPTYDSFVNGIEFIPLETTDSSLIGEVKGLVVTDDKIFVNSAREEILCFDISGKFLFRVGRIGRAPGEYISPYSISVCDNIVYVLCQESGKVLCYDAVLGKHINDISLNKFYVQIEVSDGYIYAVDMTTRPFAIDAIQLSNPTECKELYCVVEGERVYSSFMQLFKSSDNGTCYWVDPLRGEVYLLESGEMIPYIDFDFGKYEYPEDYLMSGGNITQTSMVSAVCNFYRVNNICTISFGGADNDIHTLLYDLDSGQQINLGFLKYKGPELPEAYYKKKPVDFKAANKRFYSLYIPNYNAECGILPDNYKSYERMKGVTNEDNIALIAFDLKL